MCIILFVSFLSFCCIQHPPSLILTLIIVLAVGVEILQSARATLFMMRFARASLSCHNNTTAVHTAKDEITDTAHFFTLARYGLCSILRMLEYIATSLSSTLLVVYTKQPKQSRETSESSAK